MATSFAASSGASTDPEIERLSRALAVGLAEPAERQVFRNYLRRSRFTEHRVDLAKLLADPTATRLNSRVAAELGVEPTAVFSKLASVGPLDVLVAYRNDRRSWRGDDNYVVVGYRNAQNRHVLGFDSNGTAVGLELGRMVPGIVQVLIQPAERKHVRIGPQPSHDDVVIEDANENTMGGLMRLQEPDGSFMEMQLADWYARRATVQSAEAGIGIMGTCYEDCEEGGGSGSGGGGVAPPDTTFLETFYPRDGDCNGAPDPTFYATYFVNGTVFRSGELQYSEVPVYYPTTVHDPLIFSRIHTGAGEYIQVRIVERDSGFCGGNDDFGQRNWYEFDNNAVRTVFKSNGIPTFDLTLLWTPITY